MLSKKFEFKFLIKFSNYLPELVPGGIHMAEDFFIKEKPNKGKKAQNIKIQNKSSEIFK